MKKREEKKRIQHIHFITKLFKEDKNDISLRTLNSEITRIKNQFLSELENLAQKGNPKYPTFQNQYIRTFGRDEIITEIGYIYVNSIIEKTQEIYKKSKKRNYFEEVFDAG